MDRSLYYLPGRGGHLETGLGQGIRCRGWSVTGRETVGEFRTLSFQEQIDTIAEDITQHFWNDQAHIVAVSYGAYLFLHAQAQLSQYPGKVLLLSPIVGQFSNGEVGIGFVPPRANRLRILAEEGKFPTPHDCEIHVGAEDWQSNPDNVNSFAEKLGITVSVVSGLGHQLGKEYVGRVLDRWLI